MRTAISQDRHRLLLRLAARMADVPGFFAECGVFEGYVLKTLAVAFPERTVIGFDTFSGLPQQFWQQDEYHQPGEFAPNSFEQVKADLREVPNAVLVPGLFPASAAYRYGDASFAFVHLDFDFYQSTKQALEWLLPRMSAGGTIVLDDYDWPHCPGVRRAINELELDVLVAGHQAILKC